jgi:hypothetical protein
LENSVGKVSSFQKEEYPSVSEGEVVGFFSFVFAGSWDDKEMSTRHLFGFIIIFASDDTGIDG